MIVTLNGNPTELPDGAMLTAALERLEVEAPRRGIAVAVGEEVVPRGEWETRRLHEGDHVEIVNAIQGG